MGYELATFPEPLAQNGEAWRRLRREPDMMLEDSALPSLSAQMLALLRAMLHPSAASRPSSEEAASHEVLAVDNFEGSRVDPSEARLPDAAARSKL